MERMLPDSQQITGARSQTDDEKEEIPVHEEAELFQ